MQKQPDYIKDSFLFLFSHSLLFGRRFFCGWCWLPVESRWKTTPVRAARRYHKCPRYTSILAKATRSLAKRKEDSSILVTRNHVSVRFGLWRRVRWQCPRGLKFPYLFHFFYFFFCPRVISYSIPSVVGSRATSSWSICSFFSPLLYACRSLSPMRCSS